MCVYLDSVNEAFMCTHPVGPETEFCRPYGWRDEHDAKNSVSLLDGY